MVFQFDVETAFLNGDIDATVYISQVSSFKFPGKEEWVWKLKKSLYSTKQALRCWKKNLTTTLQKLNLSPSREDELIFLKQSKLLMLHIHVDDGLIVGKSQQEILAFLDGLRTTY